MVNIVETLVMRVSFVVFLFPSCCFQSLRNSSNHDKAQMCIISCPSVCVCVCVWAVSKDVKLVSSHIILQGATGEVYSQWPTKTLYTSCVNVPALVLTVDLRFC